MSAHESVRSNRIMSSEAVPPEQVMLVIVNFKQLICDFQIGEILRLDRQYFPSEWCNLYHLAGQLAAKT